MINHPIVNSGDGFWINDTHICTGYTIKNTINVYRPIFCYKREQFSFMVRQNIIKYAKLEASRCRNKLYKNELMKISILPEDIVDYITCYAWDIMLLL